MPSPLAEITPAAGRVIAYFTVMGHVRGHNAHTHVFQVRTNCCGVVREITRKALLRHVDSLERACRLCRAVRGPRVGVVHADLDSYPAPAVAVGQIWPRPPSLRAQPPAVWGSPC